MKRFAFVFSTLIVGMIVQIFCGRYLYFWGASPQILLFFVVALGFLKGSLFGETCGFLWGLMADVMGVSLFGTQSFLLAVAGYLSGFFRRRIASERPLAQIAIALVASTIYAVASYFLHSLFEEKAQRVLWFVFLLQMVFNVLSVATIFWVTEWWVHLWGLDQEHS